MLGDLFDFAKHHVGDAWSQMKDDPERMLLGAATPAGSKLWGGILGKDWEPMVNEFGGATPEQFDSADAEGINTGPSRVLGGIADTIAGFYGGQGVAAGLGNAFGSMGGGSSGGGLMSQIDTGGPQGGFMGQIDTGGNFMSQVDTGGPKGGFMSQIDTGGSNAGGMDVNRFMQMAQQMQGGASQQAQPQNTIPPQAPMPSGGGRQTPMPDQRDWYSQWMQSRGLPSMANGAGLLGGVGQ